MTILAIVVGGGLFFAALAVLEVGVNKLLKRTEETHLDVGGTILRLLFSFCLLVASYVMYVQNHSDWALSVIALVMGLMLLFGFGKENK